MCRKLIGFNMFQYFEESGEFGDKSVSECLGTFEDDLRYWSSSLAVDFKGESHPPQRCIPRFDVLLDQWHDPEVHQYVNHLTTEIAGRLARLIDALKRYREVGL